MNWDNGSGVGRPTGMTAFAINHPNFGINWPGHVKEADDGVAPFPPWDCQDAQITTRMQAKTISPTTNGWTADELIAGCWWTVSPGSGYWSTAKQIYHPTKGKDWEPDVVAYLVADDDLSSKGGYLRDWPYPNEIAADAKSQLIDHSYKFDAGRQQDGFTYFGSTFTVRPYDLRPNTKYWLLLRPVLRKMSVPLSTSSVLPLVPPQENWDGRGLSFWTARAPSKPKITEPSGRNNIYPANSVLNLRFSQPTPDSVVSSIYPLTSRGTNGVHIQYAARPSVTEPDPVWQDIPIQYIAPNGVLVRTTKCFYISGSSSTPGSSPLRQTFKDGEQPIRLGAEWTEANAPANGRGVGTLPTGEWQIRVRTFASGNPTLWDEDTRKPHTGVSSSWTPTNYPSNLVSEWSDPVNISVPAQVPPPIPLAPINGVAVADSVTHSATLVWQYRNTADPAYPQKSRVVRLRKVGAENWGSYTAETSLTSMLVDNLSIGEWEWQVQATDTSGKVSNWSDIARFWVVPAPASGPQIILPDETVEGASLGCGTHRVMIYRRGGKRPVGELSNISSVQWGRVRDDISDARITVENWGVDCGELLKSLQTWAYEVVIFRDNGFSVDRVWEGPITLLTYERDQVTIQAKDVMAYAYRRIIKQTMNDSGKGNGRTVVDRATRIIQNVFAADDPNLLRYLNPLAREGDAMQYRSLPAYGRTAFEEIDDMAANAGLDYTAIGRSILLWGTKYRIGTLPEFRDEDFGSPPIVSEYGMSAANLYAVSDGNGVYGEATRLDEFGRDETYGLIEMLSSTWASDSESETGTYTNEGLETVRKSFEEYAERSIADRFPPPVVVRVPDNTTLNPTAVISIQHLVPGVVIPLRAESTLRRVVANQKLDSVQVSEQDRSETITVTMSPFSRDDNAAGEETGE